MTAFADIATDLERQAIELPSWAFGNSGTRFKVFAQRGLPADPMRAYLDSGYAESITADRVGGNQAGWGA